MKKLWSLLALLSACALAPACMADELAEPQSFPASREASPQPLQSYFAQASELVIRALALIGVNYKYGGNSIATGLDCSGLVSLVFREVAGKILPRDSYAMATVGDRIALSNLQPGDLVFFNTLRRPFSHVGIYIGDHRFVHAPSSGKQVSISNMQDVYWRQRFNGARRVEL